ncbi:hypothetical protein C8F04DRAFT_1314136 [Mycena alexandri]|uniref:Uncharacterized protein n=1 Tax=Mycena alexandri TaxID=1745969 RepID=A0AAD6X842_9AGAR|nr:hypothetical protein C8F04DRAFT_1314136 [Mycena alexandri]
MAVCAFCKSSFSSSSLVRRHQLQNASCKAKFEARLGTRVGNLTSRRRRHGADVLDSQVAELPSADDLAAMLDIIPLENDLEPQQHDTGDMSDPVPDIDAQVPTEPLPRAGERPQWFKDPAPTLGAGATYQPAKTSFELIRDEEILKGGTVLGPFRDDDEWQLAKWLIKHVGHTATEEFLKLPIISDRASPSFGGKKDFFEKVDSLPGGVKWNCKILDTKGDLPDIDIDPTGATMRHEQVELWWRDPVECVKELIGNPAFRNDMRFAPQKLYADGRETVEVINEMWTASWWWEIQKRLPPGATIAPLILSSDKTMLSNFRGDNSAWPVYLTIGNIGKETRRQVSSHATVLIGYLPIPKFDCFDKNTRSLAKYRLFHRSMTVIMESIIEAGNTGVPMVCADSMMRNVWPIFAAYVADYPEQCLVACCKENRCPICTVDPNQRGGHGEHPLRDMRETLYLMRRQQDGQKDPEFENDGIRAVYPPFWTNLPHSDIFQSFTPDLLHQLHKGVFKDHLVSWCTEIIGKLEVDNRFRAMPDHHGVRHFKNGISAVSQWTGAEHKEMEKVFLGLVAAGAEPEMVKAVRGLIDFAYFASLQSHTSQTLRAMRDSLNTFHDNKQIFIDLKGRSSHFNIPKIHSLDHYEFLIRLFGSADGFNTESPERLHIDYAKNAYRASNRKDYIEQMTIWLQRQEAVARFSAYLSWVETLKVPKAALPRTATTVEPIATTTFSPTATQAPVDKDSLVISSHRLSLAKLPPTRAVPATHIMSKDGHNASRFIPALISFFGPSNSRFTPRTFDTFGTWKRVSFKLPQIPEIGKRHSTNLVRATAPAPASHTRRRAAEPAHLDYALIRTGESNPFTAGTALEGLRVAQVKVIFQVPSHYPSKPGPLAYIEWFTPLRKPDDIDGYYHISRSSRQHGPYAEIIPVDRIVRSAMLIPKKWGEDKSFLLNSHSDGHAFCLYKLGCVDSLPP